MKTTRNKINPKIRIPNPKKGLLGDDSTLSKISKEYIKSRRAANNHEKMLGMITVRIDLIFTLITSKLVKISYTVHRIVSNILDSDFFSYLRILFKESYKIDDPSDFINLLTFQFP